MNKTLIISPRLNNSYSYSALCDELGEREVLLRPWCRPRSVVDAMRELVRAIVFEVEVTLFDSEWSCDEVRALGFSVEQLSGVRKVPGVPGLNVEDIAAKVTAPSSATINLFTSGSSGRPIMVSHSLNSLTRAIKTSARHRDDVWAFAFNPTHIAGVQLFFQALANLNTLVDVTELGRADTYSAFRRNNVSHVSATPTFYRMLLPCEQPLEQVRRVVLGGEASGSALHQQLRLLFPSAKLRNIYASTEAGWLLESIGEVFSVPPKLADAIVVRDGRVHLHRCLLAYFSSSRLEADWYDTGDRVEIIEVSPLLFRFIGRDGDWVNVGGQKVNPLEVEAILDKHPAVIDARVFGRRNSVSGQLLYAEVVSRDKTLTEGDIRSYLGAHLQVFKVPRVIRFVEKIEATRSGKRLRQ